ncbi:unnamed protein product [Cladocopium goreaui]|uniref:Tetratricopeptide repeat protein 6 (TPR repeat protein 6) n=1 Tax=Cladocopium goreaui TaxID=2562237 RepID=A0A9P1CWU3_9DINO|nr:unnamed protein product [Cladocopium goreaui]
MQKLKKGMGEVCAQQALVTTLAGARPYYVVMEIFAGCARLTARGSVREGWRAMEPIDIIYGYDLKNPVTQKQILDRIGDLKPDLVTLSPRCGPWSQMQRINPNVDKVMEDRQQDIPLWRFCRKVWDEQDKNGRLVLTENPYQSAALTMDFMMERPNLHRSKIPQCAFGLKDAVSGKPHQKYTALDVNDAGMREALMEGATCRHTPEEHQPIEGNVFYNGRWQRRSALAAKWPEELCDHILRAAESAWEKCDQHAPKKLTEGREAGAAHYILPVEPTPTPEGELRRQLEKADWRGGQYDYVYFDGVARQGPYKMRQALAHLHVVLGHPSMERLVRMLMISGCSNQVVEIAKGLRCQICQAVRPPGAEPKVAATRPTRFGERVLSDSFFVWDVKGERFNVTHMIDGLTEYHMGLVSKQVGADVTTELLQNRWCAVLGPPEVLQTDGGKEYADVVQRVSRLLDFRHEVVPPGAKWRQGQVERHGAIIKLMMMRVISTQQAAGLEEIKLVAASCFNAKNRLCNRAGLSPLQAVTGKNTTVPVSVMEQLCSGQVRFAMNEELELRDALRRAERIRAAAIDSYNWIDSNQVIREGLNRRSRPPKLEGIFEGTTVYVHEPPPNRRGQHRRLQDHSSWDGPGLVVCVERQQNVPNRVWVRIRGKVRSYPLEKLRLATPDEMLGSQFSVQILEEMQDEIKKGNLRLEEDRNQPVRALPAVPNTSANMEEVDNEMLDDTQVQERMRRVRRMEIMNDVPDSIRQGALSSSSQSSRVLVRKLDASERRDLLMEDDAEMSEEPVAPAEEVEPSRLRFPEKKALFEKGRREGGLPSTLTEARVRSGMGLASRQVKNIRKLINKQRRAPMTPQARQQRSEEQSVGSLVMLAEVLEPTPHEVLWQESCKELEEQEAFWNSPLVKKKDLQKINTKIEDKVYEHRSDLARGKIVTGKARLEYQWSQLNDEWKKAYEQPLVKAVKIYFDHDALAGVPKDKVINPKRILSTRFVLTNKGGPELKDAILKARLILGGHMDPDMGKYATLAPTAALLAHNLINWIAVQKQWVVNYEDVSSAFLQGKPLPKEREVYIRLPKGYPECVWKFILEQLGVEYREDLLQLTKGGFGLPESPRLWYLCYRDTLKECDMKEMDILPGVFAAYHPDGELRALACIHVDDTRFCGDETSQEIWDKIHQKLKFGELRRATQGWTKFCGRWERQNPETLEFEYAMEEYAKDIQKVKLPTGNAKTASTAMSPEEKLQMSSILGQLNWMARQGRYDLSYGVSHVQQLAAREGRVALEWLNKVVYRAKQPAIQVVKRLKDWRNYIIVSASDAAYGAQPGGYSQGGLVICIAEKGILDGEANLAVVEAASMKIQRVVRCSMSAEVSMAATAYEHGDFVRAALAEVLNRDFDLPEWKVWASAREHYLVIDSKTGPGQASGPRQQYNDQLPADSLQRIRVGDAVAKAELFAVAAKQCQVGAAERGWSYLTTQLGTLGFSCWLLSGYGTASLPVWYFGFSAAVAYKLVRCCHDESVPGGVPHCYRPVEEELPKVVEQAWAASYAFALKTVDQWKSFSQEIIAASSGQKKDKKRKKKVSNLTASRQTETSECCGFNTGAIRQQAVPPELYPILLKLLSPNPSERLTIAVRAIRFLEQLNEKDETQRVTFLRGLPKLLQELAVISVDVDTKSPLCSQRVMRVLPRLCGPAPKDRALFFVWQRQAAEVFRQGQQQLRKAQASVGEQAVAEYEACAQLFSEAISLRANHAQYYQARGRCFLALQQYARALADFGMCCRLDEHTARHFGHRGLCFRRLGRVEEALRDYDEALRLERAKAEKDPSETHQRQAAEYYFERALVHIDLEQYEKAIEGFTQALEKRLATPYKAFFHRGICYRRVGLISESIQNLKEAINLDTTSAEAHNHLGLSHIKEQHFEEARNCFANAVELDPCSRYLNNRGLACYHLEKYTEAAEDFTAALEAEPGNASVLFNRGNASFQLGCHRDALADYAEAIRLEPENATYLHHKGLAYQGCGEVREAIACYEEAPALSAHGSKITEKPFAEMQGIIRQGSILASCTMQMGSMIVPLPEAWTHGCV